MRPIHVVTPSVPVFRSLSAGEARQVESDLGSHTRMGQSTCCPRPNRGPPQPHCAPTLAAQAQRTLPSRRVTERLAASSRWVESDIVTIDFGEPRDPRNVCRAVFDDLDRVDSAVSPQRCPLCWLRP
jgi:hypothetical protein